MDDFEGSTSAIELPRPPLSTVSTLVSITYIKSDTAGSSYNDRRYFNNGRLRQ